MRYQWDLYELRNKLQILAADYQIAENDQKKKEVLNFISMYEELLQSVIRKKNEKKDLLDDSIEYQDFHDFTHEQISSYKANDPTTLNLILQSYLPFKENYRTNCPLPDINISITNDEVITVAKDFFQKYVPTPIKKKLDSIFTEPNLLQISYSTMEETAAGLTVLDSYFQKKYIFVARKNRLLDLTILPHECFHYLIIDFGDDRAEDYNTYYLREVEGSFADILFGDYFYQQGLEFHNYFNQYLLQHFEMQISDLVISNAFIDFLTDKGRFRMNKFNKTLEVYDIVPFQDREEIMNYMTTPMDINMKYALGYLVAIDLFYIYQKDPEFSFYLLKNIHYMKEENDIIGILRRNHITFMDDGYENLKKYVKKIERQN